MSFKQFNLAEPILKAIDKIGYSKPTKIQTEAIPQILNREDVLACSQTGTGKTAAFAIPILQLLHKNNTSKKGIKVLVVTPTRELATQIADNFNTYGAFLPVISRVVVGGVPLAKQISFLKGRTDVLIATPGRLLDLVSSGHVKLSSVQTLVLDEADTMLDMGFVKDIKRILSLLPKKKQVLFFSATLPKDIKKFAMSILNNPKEIQATKVSSAAHTVEQMVYLIPKQDKKDLLVEVLKGSKKLRSLVFTRTKRGADKLVKQLEKKGIKSVAIHGNKSQNTRQNALKAFKDNRIGILIATDVASRGIDITSLPLVINYDLPNVPETYVHRIGRTGRAGMAGKAISFCDSEESAYLKTIEKLIGYKIPIATTK